MDTKQQFWQTVCLGNQAKSRSWTKYRTGSQNVEIETSSHGLVGNPNTPSLQTTYRRWNQSRGVFHQANPVSLQDVDFYSDNSGNRSTRGSVPESPESSMRKEKGKKWVLLPLRSLIPWTAAWLMVKCRIRFVSLDRCPFHLIMTCLREYKKRPYGVPGLLAAIATVSVTTCDLRSPLCSFSLTHLYPHGLYIKMNVCFLLHFNVGSYINGYLIPIHSHPVLR